MEDSNYLQYIENIGNHTIKKNDYLYANSIVIQDQDLNEFLDITGGVNAIIAPTGSGKTVLLKNILNTVHKKYDDIVLMSRTAKFQEAYNFFPRHQILDDYSEQFLTDLWNKQSEAYLEFASNDLAAKPFGPSRWTFSKSLNRVKKKKREKVLVILDDVIASPSYQSSKIINELAFGARHVGITLWVLSQNFTSIKPAIRNNIRILCAFWLDSEIERKKVIYQFLSTKNHNIGDLLYKKITGTKYQAIIISNYKSGAPLEEKVKKFIGDPKVKVVMTKEEKVPKNDLVWSMTTDPDPWIKAQKKIGLRPNERVDLLKERSILMDQTVGLSKQTVHFRQTEQPTVREWMNQPSF